MAKFHELSPSQFPELLKEINDPPKALYLEGELPAGEVIYLTVVGSRRPTAYGREVTERLIGSLRGHPVVIISGLAIGLDTLAHTTALQVGLTTIAVPGSGLDRSVLHPPSNRRLADRIVAEGGALLSELDPAKPAGIHTFPRRNRIMAGLAQAVLVVEAGERSGTLITSRLALDYNRDVLAVPGPIFSPVSRGSNGLIREGATPITSDTDFLTALGLATEETAVQLSLTGLSPTETALAELLGEEPLERDEIIERLKLPPSEVNPLLTMMEIKGLVKEELGKFRLTAY